MARSAKDNQGKTRDLRRGLLRPVGEMVPRITRRAMGRYGFAHASVITDWETIVGKDLASQSQPVKLAFPRGERTGGTLHVRVSGPLALQLQHMEPLLIERINTHFGYGAVAKLRLIQVPIRPASEKQGRAKHSGTRAAAPSAAEREALNTQLEDVEDPEIREVLSRLGEDVLRRKNATKSDQ